LPQKISKKKDFKMSAANNIIESTRLKELGNSLFRQGRYKEALPLYSEALEGNPQNFEAMSNRSTVYMKLKWYAHAYADSFRVVEFSTEENLRRKCLWKMALCQMNLNRYVRCIQICELVLGIDEGRKVEDEITKAMKVIMETTVYEMARKAWLEFKKEGFAGEDDEYVPSEGKMGKEELLELEAKMADARQVHAEKKLRKPRTVGEVSVWFRDFPAIEVRQNEHGGIGLFAKKDLDEQEFIIPQDPCPIYFSTDPKRCHHCLAIPGPSAPKHLNCSRVFCSQRCLDNAQDYHTHFCGHKVLELCDGYRGDRSMSIGVIALKLLGVALTLKQSSGCSLLKTTPADTPPLGLLWRMTDTRSVLFPNKLVVIWEEIHKACPVHLRLDPKLDMNWMIEIYAMVRSNAFGCSYLDSTDLGEYLSFVLSFFNHSCEPNTRAGSNLHGVRRTQDSTTLVPVKAGSELFVGYFDLTRTVQLRQAYCRGQYGFTCLCERCLREWKDPRYDLKSYKTQLDLIDSKS
jgi:hypothetical protein